ncbi:MAG: hypothetical protein R3D80_14510 [Paracoccaceae bacterium]
MTDFIAPCFIPLDIDALPVSRAVVVALTEGGGRLNKGARRIDRLTRGALKRLVALGKGFSPAPGEAVEMDRPHGGRGVGGGSTASWGRRRPARPVELSAPRRSARTCWWSRRRSDTCPRLCSARCSRPTISATTRPARTARRRPGR